MDGLRIPPNPANGVVRSTPDNGILYIAGSKKAIAHVSPPMSSVDEPNSMPLPVKILSMRLDILTIECDPNWTNNRKHFAAMNQHFYVGIWNLYNSEKVFGHKAHIGKYSKQNGVFAMCYTNNDQVLSTVDSVCIKFCIKSNRYVKYSLNPKWNICVLKMSPYNDNIVAAGTKNGQIILLDTKDFSLLHTLRGHNTEIISIEWMKLKLTASTNTTVTKPMKYSKKKEYQLKANNGKKEITTSKSPNYDLNLNVDILCETTSMNNLNLKANSYDSVNNCAESHIENIQNNEKYTEEMLNVSNLPENNSTNKLNLEVESDDIDSTAGTLENIRNAEKLYLIEVEQTLKDNILSEAINSTNNLNVKSYISDSDSNESLNSAESYIENTKQFHSIDDDEISDKTDNIDSANNVLNVESHVNIFENNQNSEQMNSIEFDQMLKNNIQSESNTNFKFNCNGNGLNNNDSNAAGTSENITLQHIQNDKSFNSIEGDLILKEDDLTVANCTSNSHLKVLSNDKDLANIDWNADDCEIGTLINLCEADETLKFNGDNKKNKTFINDDDDDDAHKVPSNIDMPNVELEEKICIASSGKSDNNICLWDTKTGVGMQKIEMKKNYRVMKGQENDVHIFWINNSMLAALSLAVYEITVINLQWMGENKFEIEKNKIASELKFDLAIIQNRTKFNENVSRRPIWTFTYKRSRYLVFGDINSNHFNTKGIYSTMALTHCDVKQCPHDPKRIVIGGNGYKLYKFDIADFTSNIYEMISYTKEYLSQIISIAWHPTNKDMLAYSSTDGFICIIDISKNDIEPIFIKNVSNEFGQISWCQIETEERKQQCALLVCRSGKLLCYTEDKFYQNFSYVNTYDVYTASAGKHCIAVGMKTGGLSLFSLQLKYLWYMKITKSCITYCAWSSLVPNRLAVSSSDGEIYLFTICTNDNEKDVVQADGKLNADKFKINQVSWSSQNENYLLSCGYDNTVRVWDTEKMVCISYVCYSFKMYSAIFLPNDGNLVLASGMSETMHIFDIRNHSVKSESKKPRFFDKTALRFELAKEDCSKKIDNENNKKQEIRQTIIDDKKIASTAINKAKAEPVNNHSNNAECAPIQLTYSTILPLTNKDFNKNALQSLRSIIKPDTDGKLALHSHLYSTHENVRKLLEIELQNHKDLNTSSIAHLLIPQMCGNLQMDILKNIDSKTLSELHISLAPSISYEFWKKCCKAYASQCIEKNMTLQAIPYLLCSHKYNESVDALCAGHFYLEAWIIAKLYKDIDDIKCYNSITTQWIKYLETKGNLDGAALVAASVEDYATAIRMLSKRNNGCKEAKAILEWMESLGQ